MTKQLMYLFLTMIITRTLSSGTAPAGQSNASLKRLDRLHIEQFAVYNALGEISQKAQVTIGVDAVEPKQESTVVLDFPGGKVADLLDMFVAAAPDYRWTETSSGVIHVSRTSAHVSLLDVVMSYPGAVKKTRRNIWEDIANRPEVAAWMQSNSCLRGELFNGKEFREHDDPISIGPGSLTLTELLDQVAVKSRVNYWAVLQSPSDTPCRIQIILW